MFGVSKINSIANKFHLKEIDWVIYFSAEGNEGKEIGKYGVAYRDRVNNTTQPGRRINFEDVLSKRKIQKNYPHTVGLFLESRGKGSSWYPDYIETRIVHSEKDFQEWIKEAEATK